jgi:hypothetical protein
MASHGALMALSWGFLLPFGVLSARLLRSEQNALWFKIHRDVQPVGLLAAFGGWVVALASPFDVLGSGIYDAQFAHGLMGTVAMVLGIFQPIHAFFRPHKPGQDEDPVSHRKTWEIVHKSSGYIAVVIGLVNCFIGMALSGKYEDYFFNALVASVVFLVVFGLCAYCRQRHLKPGNHQPVSTRESDSDAVATAATNNLTITSITHL